MSTNIKKMVLISKQIRPLKVNIGTVSIALPTGAVAVGADLQIQQQQYCSSNVLTKNNVLVCRIRPISGELLPGSITGIIT